MVHRYKDITGQKFGKLTVISYAYTGKNRSSYWNCLCDCGNPNMVIYGSGTLRVGDAKSCGCLRKTRGGSKGHYIHGLTKHPLFRRWQKIKERVFNPNAINYSRYGGAGVTMYEGWINDPKAFVEYIIGLYPNWKELIDQKYQIDRIDNLRGYEPGNLRLATIKEQARNRKTTIYICYKGIMMSLKDVYDLEDRCITYSGLVKRIKSGMDIEEAFNS